MQYYTKEEMLLALQQASNKIDTLTKSCKEYTRGTNDCFALLYEYDHKLRGKSKARDIISEPYSSVKEWLGCLSAAGYTLETYAEYCGYEVIRTKKPRLGDIAFERSAMINNGDFWISTKENNTGVGRIRQTQFFERRLLVLARPIRS